MSPRLQAWLNKKVAELLGMEEASLVAHVLAQLAKRCSPAALVSELAGILDDEAEGFVLKLYRMLIYETEKSAAGLA